MNHGLDAIALDAATRGDPQFVVPRHPAVIRSVVTATVAGGLLVDGLVSRRVLRGSTAQRTLPEVLPLLDGTRTWEQIAEASGLSTDEVRQVLGVLYAAGLLGEGPDVSTSGAMHAFLGRTFDATRRHASAGAARDALLGARIALVPSPGELPGFREAMLREGLDLAPVEAVLAEPRPNDIVVALLGAARPETIDTATAVRDRGVPVLPVIAGAERLVIGPVGHRDHNPCPRCVALAAESPGFGGAPDSFPSASPPARPGLLASLAPEAIALEVVLHAAGVGTARSATEAIVITDAPVATRYEYVSRRPGCPSCGISGPPKAAPSALVYEESVAFPPARLRSPRTHQQHFEPENIALSHEQRDFGGEEVPLPQVDGVPEHPGRVTVGALGAILGTAFGLKPPRLAKPGKVRRWAPTGGNLGSPQAYVTVSSVPGVPDGRYAYRADRHVLQRLDGTVAGVPDGVRLVVVGELYRVWKKYNTFSYRVVALDAGVALTHVAVAAARHGLTLRNDHGWDETTIAAELSLDLGQQSVSAVVHLEDSS